MYPERSPKELTVVEFKRISAEKRKEAAQVLADNVRRLMQEQILLLRATRGMLKALAGPSQGFFLVKQSTAEQIAKVIEDLYGTKP